MVNWTLILLVIALVAAFFGFEGLAGIEIGIARTLFLISLVGLAALGVIRALRGRTS